MALSLPFSVTWVVACAAVLLVAALLRRWARGAAGKPAADAVAMPSLDEQERRLAAFCSQPFRAECAITSSVAAGAAAAADDDMLIVQSREGCYVTVTMPREEADGAANEGSSSGNSSHSSSHSSRHPPHNNNTTTSSSNNSNSNSNSNSSSRHHRHHLTTTVRLLDLATYDFHSFTTHPAIVDVAQRTVAAYGVGSCGPRGFYGTIKPHLDLERDLARFLDTDEAVVYSLAYATVTTVIPCFASRGDYLVHDEAISSAVMEGCLLSRAHTTSYAHNDMTSLQAALEAVAARDGAGKGCPHRRFVVAEGVYKNTGTIAPLPRILELCARYRFRLILDDSYGFGVLGAHGRGTPEHFGLTTRGAVDVYIGSLSTALGGVGGFCAGDSVVCDHQRIAGSGYVFSASLPPYVTACASAVLSRLSREATCGAALRAHAQHARAALRAARYDHGKIDLVDCLDDASPLIVLAVTPGYVASRAATTAHARGRRDGADDRVAGEGATGDEEGAASTTEEATAAAATASGQQPQQQQEDEDEEKEKKGGGDGRFAVEEQLRRVVVAVRRARVAIQRHVYDTNEPVKNTPALRIVLKSSATEEEMHAATAAIVRALEDEFA